MGSRGYDDARGVRAQAARAVVAEVRIALVRGDHHILERACGDRPGLGPVVSTASACTSNSVYRRQSRSLAIVAGTPLCLSLLRSAMGLEAREKIGIDEGAPGICRHVIEVRARKLASSQGAWVQRQYGHGPTVSDDRCRGARLKTGRATTPRPLAPTAGAPPGSPAQGRSVGGAASSSGPRSRRPRR